MAKVGTSWVLTALLLGGILAVIGGLVSVAVGIWLLLLPPPSASMEVSPDTEVVIPEAGLFSSSVQVFVDLEIDQSPRELGCQMVDDRGREQSLARLDGLFWVLTDPQVVEGTTWHPLTEVSLGGAAATLSCSELPAGARLASTSPTPLGESRGIVAPFALGSGAVFVLLGAGGLVAARLAGQRHRS